MSVPLLLAQLLPSLSDLTWRDIGFALFAGLVLWCLISIAFALDDLARSLRVATNTEELQDIYRTLIEIEQHTQGIASQLDQLQGVDSTLDRIEQHTAALATKADSLDQGLCALPPTLKRSPSRHPWPVCRCSLRPSLKGSVRQRGRPPKRARRG